jgi:NAD(P)-dependent dehydrogenase (short-subunit alcohol dehydrogenase family)
MKERIQNTTVLISGSTDGIGLQTALTLAQMGATVLLHGRDKHRGAIVLDELRKTTGNQHIDLFVADLSSMARVRELAGNVTSAYPRLDVLINNAGVYMNERILTADGLETTFAVNHLAAFVLTHHLLDLLKRSAPSRIITVSSVAHQRGSLDFNNLQGERKFSPYGAYALSKLANILFTVELAERLAGTGVTANCLHPGVINTKLLRKGFAIGGDSLEAGAETPVYLATSPAVEGITGKYFFKNREVKLSSHAVDRRDRRELWRVSEGLAGIHSGNN